MSPPSQNGTAQHAPADERAPLLGKSSNGLPVGKRLAKHMSTNITKSYGDVALLGCYVITGLLDSSAVFIWGSFVSMQTGNTVYLGLGLVEPAADTRWIRSLISIGFFCLGSLFFSSYHRYFTPRKRWVLASSFLLQLVLILVSALMVTLGPETGKDGPVTEWVAIPLALIAFQSSGQAVASRALQYNGLTSVVLTSNYCDLFSDPKLFTAGITENVERNRRTAAPILLLIGAICGGVFAHSPVGLAGALWSAVILKAMVIFAWLVWAPEPETDD